MFSKQVDKAPKSNAKVLGALGVAALAGLGYMGYSSLCASEPTALDLNSLPTDNAANWERIARVEDALTGMREHYGAIAAQFRGEADIRYRQATELMALVGGVADGDEISFSSGRSTPKGVMAEATRGLKVNAETGRESAQMVAPEGLFKAVEFIRSQKEFLERAGITVNEELDTLSVTNLKFQHITMDLGALAEKTYQESKQLERLMAFMLKNKNQQATLGKLFQLNFQRLLNILKSSFEQLNKMEKQLTDINIEMQHAINRLEHSNGLATAAYQKEIDKFELESGRARLKIEQLQKEYTRQANKEFPYKPREVPKPADPRKMQHVCNPKEVVGQIKKYKTETYKTGWWVFGKTHTRKVFDKMQPIYKDCDAAKALFDIANNNTWAARQQEYEARRVAAANAFADRQEAWMVAQNKKLDDNMKMQEAWELKEYEYNKKTEQVQTKQTDFSKYMQVIITYQEAIMGSQKAVLYICKKFKVNIESSLTNLKTTNDIMNPNPPPAQFDAGSTDFDPFVEEAETQLAGYDDGDLDDLFGADEVTPEAIDNAFDGAGESAAGLSMDLFIGIIKGDIIDLKVQSFCTQKSVEIEVQKWSTIGKVGYNPQGQLPKLCGKLEGATSADSVAESCTDPILCAPI